MTAETKQKGLSYRLGFWMGRFSGRYHRLEAGAVEWLMNKGVPAGLAGIFRWSVRLALAGIFLYLAFWVAVLCIGVFAISEVLKKSPDDGDELVCIDGRRLCPDPHAPENINDPRFDTDL